MAVPTTTIETLVPFQFATDGSVAVETNPINQTTQHVKSLVATNPGERLIYTDYGAGVVAQLFEGDTQAIQTQITIAISDALVRWEPNIVTTSVAPVMSADGSGVIDIDIVYGSLDNPQAPVSSSPALNRAVLRPGSGVTEIIRA